MVFSWFGCAIAFELSRVPVNSLWRQGVATNPLARCSDEDFIAQFRSIGPSALARKLNITERNILQRRRVLERKYKVAISGPGKQVAPISSHPHRICIEVPTGTVLVGSDAHIWPGPPSTAFKAFTAFAKRLKPSVVVLNGDVLDFPKISRHAPIGWETQPDPQSEIEAAQDQLFELEKAAGKARKIWTAGNHDLRFETRLATIAPEYARVAGVHLQDHFPQWEPCWSVWVNDTVIKHRYKGGIHATHNSTLNAGRHMITGHLHSAKVTPFTDYNGTRYGVDTGCLADTESKAFVDWTEDNPKNWRSGFCVLTFHQGHLLMPELCTVFGPDKVQFRGEIIRV
jgi:Calcineurin-like phosphoesterase